MSAIEVVFWLSVVAIVYSYVGYPAVLWFLSGIRQRDYGHVADSNETLPSVTLIVSAFNEEKVIREKIENALSLDYPAELLEIVVISDGSTDRTCEIVLEFADKGIVLRHHEERVGKTAGLNRAVPLAKGKIVVFSDANSTYERGALRSLLKPFADSTVGFVTGWTRYGSGDSMTDAHSVGLYSRLEFVTKTLESRLGTCIGADGAIFAIRKELYCPLKDYDINDFVIPLSINRQGYRGVLQPEAICFEKDAGSTKGEFHRQVRITSRTIRAIINYRELLNPFRFGFLAFELFSHKLSKFLVPTLMIVALASNLLLLGAGHVYVLTLALQVSFYMAAGAASLTPSQGSVARALDAAHTFVVVNSAIALAWVRYFQGETYTTWSPTKR